MITGKSESLGHLNYKDSIFGWPQELWHAISLSWLVNFPSIRLPISKIDWTQREICKDL